MVIRKSASKPPCSECAKKVYEESGLKIPFHKFPEDRDLFKKWIVAIRRDVGWDGKYLLPRRPSLWKRTNPWAARPWQPLFSNHKSELLKISYRLQLKLRFCRRSFAVITSTLQPKLQLWIFQSTEILVFKWRRYSWKFHKWKRFQQFWGMIFLLAWLKTKIVALNAYPKRIKIGYNLWASFRSQKKADFTFPFISRDSTW